MVTLNYWNADRLKDIAWDALPHHVQGRDFGATAAAAVSVAVEANGVDFGSITARAAAIEKVAYYLAGYAAD